MTGHGATHRRLSAVHDALAAGDLASAVGHARAFLGGPADEDDPAEHAASASAARRFVAIAGGAAVDPPCDSLSTALEMIDLAAAASRCRADVATFAALAGDALASLEAAGRRIGFEHAGGPLGPIRVDLWVDAASASAAADYLAVLLRAASRLDDERRALALRGRLVFRFLGDDAWQVISSMNDTADCLRRMGRMADAARHYEAVLRDYSRLSDRFAAGGEAPDNDDRLALEALADTYRGCLRLEPARPRDDLDLKIQLIDDILNRAEPS